MLKNLKKPLALLLGAGLLLGALSGCGAAEEEPAGEETDYIDVNASLSGQTLTAGAAEDDVFSLAVEYNKKLNPITTTSSLNQMVGGLVYDQIFEVDDNYNLSSRVLDDWYVSESGTLVLEVRDDVPMHDGSMLTAEDIAYSISRVATQGVTYYLSRLGTCYASAYQGTVYVSGDYVNTMLPYRLTLPIIKAGSILEDAPVGSGPYMWSEDKSCLEKFDSYENAENLPVDTVYLQEYTDLAKLITQYESGEVDITVNDPTSIYNMGYGGMNEKRVFSTTNLHYIGFNGYSTFLCYAQYRTALNYIVDRYNIANGVLDGAAVPSALPIHPNSSLFDTALNDSLAYSTQRCLTEFEKLGCRDLDGDGQLEFAISGSKVEIDLTFIVCSDNASKVVAARKIAEDMQSIGLDVTLQELSWKEYQEALKNPRDEDGKPTWDMYYAEVALTPDWNLLPLVEALPQDSYRTNLNFGKWDMPVVEDAIYSYLSANDETRPSAASAMLTQISANGVIIPVCFEEREVISHLGVITGMVPNQYNIFRDFDQWTINLDD